MNKISVRKFIIDLKNVRKELGFTQKDIKKFGQASVSKIESRKDLKISTIIEYLNCLGLQLEVNAVAYDENQQEIQRFELLKGNQAKAKKSVKNEKKGEGIDDE